MAAAGGNGAMAASMRSLCKSRVVKSLGDTLLVNRMYLLPGVKRFLGRHSHASTPAAMHRAAAGVNAGLGVGRKRLAARFD